MSDTTPTTHSPLGRLTKARPREVRHDREAWRQFAACSQVGPDLFFPAGSTGAAADQIDRAKTICASCPVRLPCLRFAVTTNQEFGVWGGRDTDERRNLRRRWRTGPPVLDTERRSLRALAPISGAVNPARRPAAWCEAVQLGGLK